MKDKTIAAEAFFSGRKNFFLDFKLARNKSNYMRITNLVRFVDGRATVKEPFVNKGNIR